MRLIDADKMKAHYAWWGAESASEEMKENKKIFDTIIDLQPTVEAEPIRHGHWMGINEYCKKHDCIPSGMGIYYWCSECEKAEPKTSDYCPNCGAQMDGKENEK